MQRKAHIICSILVVVMSSSQAVATSITNLTESPYGFKMRIAGEEKLIKIAPDETWRTQATPVTVQMGKREKILDNAGEYTLWPDGSLVLQQLQNHRRGD